MVLLLVLGLAAPAPEVGPDHYRSNNHGDSDDYRQGSSGFLNRFFSKFKTTFSYTKYCIRVVKSMANFAELLTKFFDAILAFGSVFP